MKPSVTALSGPGGGLVVAPAQKASLMGFQFDSNQCRDQFVTALTCSLRLGAILWPSGLVSFCVCFFILTHMVVLILGVGLFLKMVVDIISPKQSIIFRWLICWG